MAYVRGVVTRDVMLIIVPKDQRRTLVHNRVGLLLLIQATTEVIVEDILVLDTKENDAQDILLADQVLIPQ